jgi:hypothetical protein
VLALTLPGFRIAKPPAHPSPAPVRVLMASAKGKKTQNPSDSTKEIPGSSEVWMQEPCANLKRPRPYASGAEWHSTRENTAETLIILPDSEASTTQQGQISGQDTRSTRRDNLSESLCTAVPPDPFSAHPNETCGFLAGFGDTAVTEPEHDVRRSIAADGRNRRQSVTSIDSCSFKPAKPCELVYSRITVITLL